MKKTTLTLAVITALFAACQKETSEPLAPETLQENARKDTRTFYGPSVDLGDGNARTFYTETKEGIPLELGIVLKAQTLNNLPATTQQFSLLFHQKAGVTGFTHALFDWNPNGHDPLFIYGAPHFDFHFYRGITEAERMMITPFDSVQFANAPAAIYQPPAYLNTAEGVPMMGVHWIDLLAPEFNGGVFTRTFIYGSYDGEFVFYEPMVTLAHLLTQPDEIIEIRQPQAFQEAGYYPLNYRVQYSTNPDEYIISIIDLTYMPAQ